MITKNVALVRNWDYTEHLACQNCARTDNLHRIFVKHTFRSTELCFCERCWKEIMNNVWPDYKRPEEKGGK